MTSEIINNRPVYVKKGGTIAMGIWWSCNSWRISSLSKKGKCAGMKTYTDEFCVGNVGGYDWEWQPTKNNWDDENQKKYLPPGQSLYFDFQHCWTRPGKTKLRTR